jgi:hypothetical protein
MRLYICYTKHKTEHLNVCRPWQAHVWRGKNNPRYCVSDTNICGSRRMADIFYAELKYSPIWGSYSIGEEQQATGPSANKPDSSTARQFV